MNYKSRSMSSYLAKKIMNEATFKKHSPPKNHTTKMVKFNWDRCPNMVGEQLRSKAEKIKLLYFARLPQGSGTL